MSMSESEIERYAAEWDIAGKDPDTVAHVDAPWTPAQVDSLRRYQQESHFHPFTCPNRDPSTHETTRDLGVLQPTPAGWSCPSCDYVQTWAHPWMADFSWLKHEQRVLAAIGHDRERFEGGPTADVEIQMTGNPKWVRALRGDETVTIVINGRPALGINAEGTVGHWPDGETWVPLVT